MQLSIEVHVARIRMPGGIDELRPLLEHLWGDHGYRVFAAHFNSGYREDRVGVGWQFARSRGWPRRGGRNAACCVNLQMVRPPGIVPEICKHPERGGLHEWLQAAGVYGRAQDQVLVALDEQLVSSVADLRTLYERRRGDFNGMLTNLTAASRVTIRSALEWGM